MKTTRENRKARKGLRKRNLVPSPLPAIDDELYTKGLAWVDSLAGSPIIKDEYEAVFPNSVWHSKIREGNFPE